MKRDSVMLYASSITPRLKYIVPYVLGEVEITDSISHFQNSTGIKINYSSEKLNDGSFQIISTGLLHQENITEQKVDCFDWQGLKAFFPSNGDLSFDILSASFYLLSRYEEYLPHEKDVHGRYSHTNSLAYREGFLTLPLINLWAIRLQEILGKHFSVEDVRLSESKFRFTPTYDIDEAYCYLHQPIWKNVFGFYKDLLRGKMDHVLERGNVYSGKVKDPYDTFEWLDILHDRYKLDPLYFFLTLIKKGKQDANLFSSSNAIKQLYKRISEKYQTGLHPSWISGDEEGLLVKEKECLQQIIGKDVIRSRNHYLRITIPTTYRNLISLNIQNDHSMAYGSVNGFRASFAKPFYWYDLEKEVQTNLLIHPFCFMEAASFFHQGYSALEAGVEMQYYFDLVKSVQGEFITLFHNHFLTEQPEWLEWRRMYEGFLEKNFG